MRHTDLHVLLLCFNHRLKVNIYLDTESLIIGLPLTPLFLDIIHAFSALFSVDFELFNFIEARRFLCEGRCLSRVIT